MKKSIFTLLGIVFISGGIYCKKYEDNLIDLDATVCCAQMGEVASISSTNETDLKLHGKSAYLMEYGTRSKIYSENENLRLPIASMCKIMTLLVVFDEIKAGNLKIDEEISVSERAASMGGSQVFLEAKAKYPVAELIKSIVVCSANDSCVALAERTYGNETLFVDKMNEKARELQLADTLFANCTGLPKEPQYSCAKDVAIMLKTLLSHEEYYQFGKVWMDKFQHPGGRYTEITNTNKLIRFYDGCDGGKTGFTNEAGFCLAATAKRNNMRIISVVIGEENSKTRFDDVRTMFDYAFANYQLTPIASIDTPIAQKTVTGGKEKTVGVVPKRNAYVFEKRGEKSNYDTKIDCNTIRAPVKQGAKVGELILFKEGIEIDRVPLIAEKSVKKATFADRFKEIANGWNARKE